MLCVLICDQVDTSRRQIGNQNKQLLFNAPITTLATALAETDEIWSECTDPEPASYILRPDQVTITPSTPAIGHDIEVSIKGNAKKRIDGGTVVVNLALGVIKFKHELDLCDSLRSVEASVQCPIPEGENDIVIKAHIPDNVPRLPIKANVIVNTGKDGDEVVTCFNVQFKLDPK